MSILYIGNKLSNYGYCPSGVETLGEKLKEITEVQTVSNKKNNLVRMADMMFSMIKEFSNYELVLIDAYSGKGFWYAIICSFITIVLNKKYILILRGGNLPKSIRSKRSLSNYIFKNSLYNIVPSLYLGEHFTSLKINTKYIPNFIEIKKYKFKKRELCKPSLLWVRSFHKVYNPQMAILVLKELQKTYPKAKLCMVGPEKDGSLGDCRNLAEKLGITKSVEFPGFLIKNKWIEKSKDYDFFINTTNYDNHPVSVIEAMSLGLPIISTNAGGLRYMHKDGYDALIVNRNDFRAMAKKIIFLINRSKLVKTLTKNARLEAEKFDWDFIKNSWQKILKH